MRQHQQRLLAELPEGAQARFEDTKRHQKMVITFGDKSRFVLLSKSNSDCARAVKNMVGDVRRELRTLGAIQ